jgi:hypothetical protein
MPEIEFEMIPKELLTLCCSASSTLIWNLRWNAVAISFESSVAGWFELKFNSLSR